MLGVSAAEQARTYFVLEVNREMADNRIMNNAAASSLSPAAPTAIVYDSMNARDARRNGGFVVHAVWFHYGACRYLAQETTFSAFEFYRVLDGGLEMYMGGLADMARECPRLASEALRALATVAVSR